MGDQNLPASQLYLYSISTPVLVASVLAAKWMKETRTQTSALLKAKEVKDSGAGTGLVAYMGLLINQPGCQHCIATSGQGRLSLGEPRTDTTGPFMAAACMGSDLERGEGTLAPQYCFEPARLM